MKWVYILVISFILTNCATNKFLFSSTPAKEIKDVDYFEPFAYIHLIETGNNSQFSDSLSLITKINLDTILATKKSKLRLSEKIVIKNDTLRTRIENELGYLSRLILSQQTIQGIKLTPAIDSILESRNQRFAMATIATGFGRAKGNFAGQIAKGVAVGILTLGMAVPTPVKSDLTMYTFLFDSKKKEIAFFRKLFADRQREPTDPEFIERQLIETLKGYYFQ